MFNTFNLDQNRHILSGQHQNTMHSLMGVDLVNSATLYIFSPRLHNQQHKRSYIYNFNSSMCDHVLDVVNESLRGVGDINNLSFMDGVPEANTAILPNANGVPVNLNTFSELWSFLLVIDLQRGSTLPNPMNGYAHPLPVDVRFMYTGYCDDEPVNTLNMGGGNAVNPRSVLIITHHSYIQRGMQLDSTRAIPIVHTLTDVDIVPPDVVRMLDQGAGALEYYNTPAKLMDSINITNTGMGMNDNLVNVDGSEVAHISTFRGNIPTVTSLNSPRHHLRDIVRVIGDSYIDLADKSATSDINMQSQYLSGLKSAFQSAHTPSVIAVAPIDPTVPITLNTLMASYPNLIVNDCRVPHTSQWDVVSQEAPNVVNIYSSLISTTLPSLLVANNISQIAFRYSSVNINNSFTSIEQDDTHELLDIATFVPLSPEMVKQKYMSLLRYLRRTLFPVVKAAAGDFDLLVYTSVAGVNIVSLRYYAYPSLTVDNAYYESYNSLGGIMSPIVGTNSEFIHNVANMSNVIHQVSPV